jgi:5-methylcytosine-specific restriction enzyme subunit McrC
MAQVREYGWITCDGQQSPTLDRAVVSEATFEWLLELKMAWRGENTPLHLESRQWLKLDSYVGYLESPIGESIEILPKTRRTIPDSTELLAGRHLLHRMLLTAMGLKPREVGIAHLRRFRQPLHEWVMSMFLSELADLVRRGIRSDYQNIEEESRFVRGHLDMARQLRQRPDRATWFHIKHDIFSPEIIENRLLATALVYVRRATKDPDNWRLSNELTLVMAEIPTVSEPALYLDKWQSGKLMRSYDAVHPWCQMVIEKLNPQSQKGAHKGIALLFPMERLFESYVASILKRKVGEVLKAQVSSQYLVRHAPFSENKSKNWFRLKPDLLLQDRFSTHVMDTKWKLLDEEADGRKDKYNISQADMYQLFAYGHKYMNGRGNMALIYPRHDEFNYPLPRFSLSEYLHLWVIPFDLEEGTLMGGEWCEMMPALARVEPDSKVG